MNHSDLAPPSARTWKRHICPRCRSEHVRRSRRRDLERFLAMLDWFPYRCVDCHERFFRHGRR
jgi:hypothetical protein